MKGARGGAGGSEEESKLNVLNDVRTGRASKESPTGLVWPPHGPTVLGHALSNCALQSSPIMSRTKRQCETSLPALNSSLASAASLHRSISPPLISQC